MKKITVKQEDFKDCGAACISSILKYYDGYVNLEQIRSDTCLSKNGISAYHIVEALKKYGFQSYGAKVSIKNLFSPKIIYPAIAHVHYPNGLDHYVVIYKITKKFITIMNPAKGMEKLTIKEFSNIYTGILILMYPLSKIIKLDKNTTLKKIFYEFLKKEPNLIRKILLISILYLICLFMTSFYTQIIMNSVYTLDKIIIYFICLIFLIIYSFKIYFAYLKDYLLTYLNKNLDFYLILPFISHIFKLPLKNMATKSTGEIMKRVNELMDIKSLISELFTTIITSIIQIVASFLILYFINAKLLLVISIILIIYVTVSLVSNKYLLNLIEDNITYETEFNRVLVEDISCYHTIKNSNKLNSVLTIIEDKMTKFLSSNFNLSLFLNKLNYLKSSFEELGIYFIYTLGFILILNNHLSLVSLITFTSILSFLVDPLKNILALLPKYNFIQQSFNKISDYLSLYEEDLKDTNGIFYPGDITINNLSFSYNNYNYPLNDLTLTIKEGSKVLLKGPSGCGKSSLCKLLYRLYEPNKGSIKIKDIDIKNYDLVTLRNHIIYVSQQEKLFQDTILNNITLHEQYDLAEVETVIKLCALESLIDTLPFKLDTLLLEESSNLSGGQKQRIILARALMKKADIIVLDEALSEVDLVTEKKIIKNLITYYPDKTLIYVSHKKLDTMFKERVDLC